MINEIESSGEVPAKGEEGLEGTESTGESEGDAAGENRLQWLVRVVRKSYQDGGFPMIANGR